MSFKNRKKYKKNITIVFWLLILCIYIIVFLVRIKLVGNMSLNDFMKGISDSLLGIIFPVFAINIFYEYLKKEEDEESLSEKITQSIILNEQVVSRFDKEVRKEFIRTTIRSLMGKKEGDILFDAIVEPYISQVYTFRTGFDYYITYENIKGPVKINDDFIISNKDYYFVHQNLAYTKHIKNYADSNTEYKIIKAGFAYSEDTLDKWFGDENIFFREVISLTDAHRKVLSTFDKDQLNTFINKILQFQVTINNQSLELIDVDLQDKHGFLLLFKLYLNDNNLIDECSYNISFKLPHMKSLNKFLVVLSEPTYRPLIHFEYIKDEMNVSTIPFFDEEVYSNLNEKSIVKEKYIQHIGYNAIKVKLNNWVLPRSGVVFTWESCDNSK